MLSPLNAPVLAKPPPPSRQSAAPGNGEGAAEDFAHALDNAVSKQPSGAERERLRGAARSPPGREAANANNAAKAQPQPTPALVKGKTGEALPPQDDDEPLATDGSPAAPGVTTLLAELRAAAPTATAGASVDAAGKTAITPEPSVPSDPSAPSASPARAMQSDSAKRSSHGIAAGTSNATTGHDAGVAMSLAAAAATNRTSAEGGGNNSESSRDSFAQQLAAAAPQTGLASQGDTAFGMPALLAAAAPGAAGAAGAAAVAVQAEAHLPATPGSADFGPQLGAQISTFVRNGIEHARLHLNPAEMGPVSVQIQLDGQTALVHLSAENPHTRQALEEAMHLLAGSLREAGLTLTGGGVFERPRQGDGAQAQADTGAGPGGQRDRSGGRPGGYNDDVQSAELLPLLARRRGVVDLVA